MKALYLACMRGLAKLEDTFCIAGLLTCTIVTVMAVINRYWLHLEIVWINDLTLYLYIPTAMCCIAVTAREDSHTSVDVFLDLACKNSPIARKICKIVICALVLGIFVFIAPLALKLFRTAWKYPEMGTLVRWFNTSWNREFLVICLGLCALHTVHTTGMHIIELRTMLQTRHSAPSGRAG